MLDQVLIIVAITALILISPGPDMVIVTRNTLLGGKTAGLRTSLGILAGNLVHIGYCALGIGWLISKSILAFTVLKYAGAAYLVYLGIASFRSPTALGDPAGAERQVNAGTWFSHGFVNNMLNPKGTLFYLGVFTVVITPETSVTTTLLLILIMQSMCAGFWLFFVYTLDHPVIRGSLERSQKAVTRIFGALLVFLGIKVMLMER
jgi:RhtB (resistance to homoserine/threonine) family protein